MKKITYLLLCTFLLLALMSNVVFAEQTDKVVLRMGITSAPEHILHLRALEFARLVEEKTNGRVEIQVYPAGQLGNLQELVEGVQQGTIAITFNTMSAIGSLYDEFGAFDTPYLFRDLDHALKAGDIESPLLIRLNKELIKSAGVRMIAVNLLGTRHLSCNKAIFRPEDLAGIKIRSIPFPMYTAAVEGLGAIAVPVDMSELSTAIVTGMVQGQENAYVTMDASKFYEIQKYVIETGHIQQLGGWIINEELYQGFSTDIQNAIIEAAQIGARFRIDSILQEENEIKKKFIKNGVSIIVPENGLDIEAFRKSCAEVVMERFGDKFKEFYEQVSKID